MNINFNHVAGIKLLERMKDKLLPNLYTLNLYNVGESPGRLHNLFSNNFPERLENLNIRSADMDLREVRLSDIYSIIRRKLRRSLSLHGFRLSTYNLESLLEMCSNLKKINFHGCKLTDSEELLMEDEFENLESLNLEEVGLSKSNIEAIGEYISTNLISFSQKFLFKYIFLFSNI